jgi:hypothetical protein
MCPDALTEEFAQLKFAGQVHVAGTGAARAGPPEATLVGEVVNGARLAAL